MCTNRFSHNTRNSVISMSLYNNNTLNSFISKYKYLQEAFLNDFIIQFSNVYAIVTNLKMIHS